MRLFNRNHNVIKGKELMSVGYDNMVIITSKVNRWRIIVNKDGSVEKGDYNPDTTLEDCMKASDKLFNSKGC